MHRRRCDHAGLFPHRAEQENVPRPTCEIEHETDHQACNDKSPHDLSFKRRQLAVLPARLGTRQCFYIHLAYYWDSSRFLVIIENTAIPAQMKFTNVEG